MFWSYLFVVGLVLLILCVARFSYILYKGRDPGVGLTSSVMVLLVLMFVGWIFGSPEGASSASDATANLATYSIDICARCPSENDAFLDREQIETRAIAGTYTLPDRVHVIFHDVSSADGAVYCGTIRWINAGSITAFHLNPMRTEGCTMLLRYIDPDTGTQAEALVPPDIHGGGYYFQVDTGYRGPVVYRRIGK